METEQIILAMVDLETDLNLLEQRLQHHTHAEIREERGKRAQALQTMRRLQMKLQQMESLLEDTHS